MSCDCPSVKNFETGCAQKPTCDKECPGKTIYFNFDSIFGDFFLKIF